MKRRIKRVFVVCLVSGMAPWTAFAGSDAPLDSLTLTPSEARSEARRVLVCEADLKACQAEGKVEPKWLVVGVVAGVVAGVISAIGVGYAIGKADRHP